MLARRPLAVTALLALVAVLNASAAPGDEYTATGGPAYVKPSTQTTFTIALTNKPSSPSQADRAKIGIPTGFTVAGASVQASTTAAGSCAVSTWTNDGTLIADGKINLRRPGGGPGTRLCPGATLTVTFAATGANDGVGVWATELLRDQDAFVLTGPQPSVTVDGTPPTVTITARPPNPSNDTSPSFEFTASEAAAFACKLDNGAFAACTSPKGYEGLAAGSHAFTITATDAAGNTGSASYTWMIETTLPTVTLGGKPGPASNSSSASFSFTSSKPASFECKLDEGAFAACTSPITYTGLADGGHTFAVRAIDAADNTGPETSYAWTVDTIAPVAAITQKPPNPSNDASPTFAFSASEAATFECKLDNGAFAACTSPKTYTVSGGPHTFTVRATDAAGNSGQASHDWTVDTVAPTVTIGSKPSNPSNVASPSFAFTASDAAAFACKLDNGAFAACTSPKGYEGLADGSHTFTVSATDAAGNSGQASYNWTIDTVGPAVTIATKPDNPSNVKSPTFGFSASESATFTCALDAGAFTPCTSPKSYSALADGVHTFTARATDAAGNSGTTSYEWLLETNLPIVTLTHKPSDPSASSSATFAFEASKLPATVSCSLDAGELAPCSSPTTFQSLSDGRHTFIAKATDAAQNQGPPTIYSWTIDTTGPTSAITDRPADPTNSRAATFVFSANEAATFQCKLDEGAFAACSPPQAYANLPEGRHTFVVKAMDALGNVGPDVGYAWTIETRAPAVAVSSSPPDLANSPTASFSFAADEPSSFQCNLDDRGFEPCSSPASYAGLRDGGHSFVVRATDAAGNVAAASRGWSIDTTAPQTTIESAPRVRTTAGFAAFTFSASEPASFQCRLDGAAFTACSSPTAYSRLARGRHRFSVRAVDLAGNVDATPADFEWTLASTRRVVAASALLAPRAGARVSGPPLLRWRRVARATYYNVQLYRGGRKVLSAWPARTRLQLRMRWRFNGRAEHLRAGAYRWYVWPGFGNPAARRYGRLLGTSTFVVSNETRRR
jgi:hypothetical protein